MVFIVDLVPTMYLGRKLQMAFLSLATAMGSSVRFYYDSDRVEFESWDTYKETVRMALEMIVKGLSRETKSPEKDLITYSGITVDCARLDPGPRLYDIGAGDERKILPIIYDIASKLDAPKCYYNNSYNKRNNSNKRIGWTHAAVTYALSVLKSPTPLEGHVRNLPFLAVASLYSKVRRSATPTDKPKFNYNINTLGAILLGGAISFLGKDIEDKGVLELYLLPDYANASYMSLRALAVEGGTHNNFAIRSLKLTRELGINFEAALSLEVAVVLASQYREAAMLHSTRIVEHLSSARLYIIFIKKSKGRRTSRPVIRSGYPLSDILLQSFSPGLLRSVDRFAWRSLKVRGKDEAGGKGVASTCVSSLYLQALNPCNPEFGYACARSALSYGDYDRRGVPADLVENALRISVLVERDVERLLERFGCQ